MLLIVLPRGILLLVVVLLLNCDENSRCLVNVDEIDDFRPLFGVFLCNGVVVLNSGGDDFGGIMMGCDCGSEWASL